MREIELRESVVSDYKEERTTSSKSRGTGTIFTPVIEVNKPDEKNTEGEYEVNAIKQHKARQG